jgi:hypothetical protein
MKTTVTLVLTGASALALAAMLTGCVPPNARQAHWAQAHLKPISKLDCPESQGELVRTSASPDGQTCSYASGQQVVVQLKLTPVSGDPQTTLAPIEADLRKLVTYDPDAAPKSDADQMPDSSSRSDWDDDHDRGKNVNINLPGVHIQAQDGGKADINVAGIHINADDRTNSAHIETRHHGFMGHGEGDVTIDANDSGAIIRSRSIGPDVHDDLILASDKPGPDGWRAVGYEAQGPRAGPLVVAIVQSRLDEHDHIFSDVKALVRRTAGG